MSGSEKAARTVRLLGLHPHLPGVELKGPEPAIWYLLIQVPRCFFGKGLGHHPFPLRMFFRPERRLLVLQLVQSRLEEPLFSFFSSLRSLHPGKKSNVRQTYSLAVFLIVLLVAFAPIEKTPLPFSATWLKWTKTKRRVSLELPQHVKSTVHCLCSDI